MCTNYSATYASQRLNAMHIKFIHQKDAPCVGGQADV